MSPLSIKSTDRKTAVDNWKRYMCFKMVTVDMRTCQTPDGPVDCFQCRYRRDHVLA